MFYPEINLENFQFELDLRYSIIRYFNQYSHWTICVSGGADSICCFLLLLAIQKRFPKHRTLNVFYLNHQVTSKEQEKQRNTILENIISQASKSKQLTVEKYFYELPIKHILNKVKNSSFEYIASQIRYKKILYINQKTLSKRATTENTCADSKNHHLTIMGHTLSDWYETLILRINRGSSIEKLVPLPFLDYPYLNTKIARPLYTLFRDDIRTFLNKYKIPYWDDPSNEDISISRNLVRKGIPLLNKKGIQKTASYFLQLQNQNTLYLKTYFFTQINKYLIKQPYNEYHLIVNELSEKQYTYFLSKLEDILKILGCLPLSKSYKEKLKNIQINTKYEFECTPYFIHHEFSNQKHLLVFRKGNLFHNIQKKKAYHKCVKYKQQYLQKNIAHIVPTSYLTNKYKIKQSYGHKQIKKIYNEYKLNQRQRKSLHSIITKDKKILYIPLSIYEYEDITEHNGVKQHEIQATI